MTKKEEVLVEEGSRQASEKCYIRTAPDGPYLVYSNPPVDQKIIPPNEESSSWMYQRELSFDSSTTPMALCHCGHSCHKPFCDGPHERATDWDSNETNDKRPLLEKAEELEDPAIVLADNERYYAFVRLCDVRGRIQNLVQLAEAEEEREFARHEATHCPTGRLVVWGKETQKVFKPPFEPSVGIVEDPGIRVSGPIWIKGGIHIESADGKSYTIRNRATLCRCEQSSGKPFCSGTHASMGFSNGLPLEEKAKSDDSAFQKVISKPVVNR